jgi:hypothetical protein
MGDLLEGFFGQFFAQATVFLFAPVSKSAL